MAHDGIAILLMAAGAARRMGGDNKMLVGWRGRPLVAHAADAARASGLRPAVLVTGRDGDAVAEAAGPGLHRVHNPRFANGFGTSLACGMAALGTLAPFARGALVQLGDMPLVGADHLGALAAAFDAAGGARVVRGAHQGRAGNPVILPAALFGALMQLDGDEGGRGLIAAAGLATVLVEIGPAALADADTPEALAALDGLQEDAR